MTASKRLPYDRSYYCCMSLLFDIEFLDQISLLEGRLQHPLPSLIRSLPGRKRLLRGARDTTSDKRRRFGFLGRCVIKDRSTRGVLIDYTAVIYNNNNGDLLNKVS